MEKAQTEDVMMISGLERSPSDISLFFPEVHANVQRRKTPCIQDRSVSQGVIGRTSRWKLNLGNVLMLKTMTF